MHKIAIITISEAGARLRNSLCEELSATDVARTDVAALWHDFDAFVFIGAMGICVRTIAPLVDDKHTDPAVVCIDSMGQYAVSVLSGHIGGANELTHRIAAAIGAQPVVTTQSDQSGLWALDTLHTRFGWSVLNSGQMQECIYAFVAKKPTALFLDIRDEGTGYMERTLPPHVTLVDDLSEVTRDKYALLIIVSHRILETPAGIAVLQYVPRIATMGIGLAHQVVDPDLHARLASHLTSHGLHWCVKNYCTIDVKADEPFVRSLQAAGNEVRFFTADELSAVEVPNPSDTVAHHVGTPSVCEAAALLGSDYGTLVIPKEKGTNYTIALSVDRRYLRRRDGGHIEIVGAGPGDPDLVSVRGRKFLEQADLILYAGSLVPRQLTLCAKQGAVVRSSASMTLEEQCTLMKDFYDRGLQIVRLHTGDPCIFGAIQEQMAFFDHHHMSYHITPGISSFLAAAAELRSQFTIPERCQTIILTRGEGRTPMPEREKLHLLARSQSTMCIFLSAAIVDDVQRELLTEYPPETPVAACYHLTWSDQRIYRGRLKDLARIVHDNNLTLTTMLVVGEAIDNRSGLSDLYSKEFSHLFRKSTKE